MREISYRVFSYNSTSLQLLRSIGAARKKNNARSPVVAHPSIRVWPHILVPLLKMYLYVGVVCAECMTCIHMHTDSVCVCGGGGGGGRVQCTYQKLWFAEIVLIISDSFLIV